MQTSIHICTTEATAVTLATVTEGIASTVTEDTAMADTVRVTVTEEGAMAQATVQAMVRWVTVIPTEIPMTPKNKQYTV